MSNSGQLRTLASLGDEVVQKPKGESNVKVSENKRSGTCVVIASALTHESDRHDLPKHLLLQLGGQSVICHVVWQLNAANLERLVVVVGFRGAAIQNEINQMLADESELFSDLSVDFVDLGRGWRGGYASSVLACRKAITSHQFLLCGADHIISEDLIRDMRMLKLESEDEDNDACVLVETDLEGMVGLPRDIVQVALRPLHAGNRIYSIGPNQSTYGGISAGLISCKSLSLFEELHRMQNDQSDGLGLFAFSKVLNEFAKRGTLRLLKTEGKSWFSVETDEEARYTEHNLSKNGHHYTLNDGRTVRLVGIPKKTTISPTDGGEWAEFNVAKWRSAVFTTKSYFQDLYNDTTDFIARLCDNKGGRENVLLVEVGCGTGEALMPLFNHAKYCVGIDFNPKFVEFCETNIPSKFKNKVKFVHGDAQRLEDILQNDIPKKWTASDMKKIVICVGNTVGIMPEEVRNNVYSQMLKVAGSDGVFVVVYWNGNTFGDACQNFYHKNPQLCGPFKGDSIDFESCTLETPSGYRTHWTTPEEAKSIFEVSIGAKIVKLEEKGKGVLVAGCLRS